MVHYYYYCFKTQDVGLGELVYIFNIQYSMHNLNKCTNHLRDFLIKMINNFAEFEHIVAQSPQDHRIVTTAANCLND